MGAKGKHSKSYGENAFTGSSAFLEAVDDNNDRRMANTAEGSGSGTSKGGVSSVSFSLAVSPTGSSVNLGTYNKHANTLKAEVFHPGSDLAPVASGNYKYIFQDQRFQYERTDWFFHSRTVECSGRNLAWDLNLFSSAHGNSLDPGSAIPAGAVYGIYGAWFLLHVLLVVVFNRTGPSSSQGGNKYYAGYKPKQKFRSSSSSAMGPGGGAAPSAATTAADRGANESTHLLGAKEALGRGGGEAAEQGKLLQNKDNKASAAVENGKAGRRSSQLQRPQPASVGEVFQIAFTGSPEVKTQPRMYYLDYTRFVCVAATICMHLDGYRYSVRNTGFVLFWVMPFLFLVSGIGLAKSQRGFPLYVIKLCVLALVGMGLNALGQLIEFGSLTGNPDLCVTSATIAQMWYVLAVLVASVVWFPFKLMLQTVREADAAADAAQQEARAGTLTDTDQEGTGTEDQMVNRAQLNPEATVSRTPALSAFCVSFLLFAGLLLASAFLPAEDGGAANRDERLNWGTARPYKVFGFLGSELAAGLVLVSLTLLTGDRGYFSWIFGSWVFLSPIFFPAEYQFFTQTVLMFFWAAVTFERPLYHTDALRTWFRAYWFFTALIVLGLVYVDQIGRCDIYPALYLWERARWFAATALLCVMFMTGTFASDDPCGCTRWTNYWALFAYLSCQFVGNVFAKLGPGKWFGAPVLYLSIIPFIIYYHFLPDRRTAAAQTGVTRAARRDTGDTGAVHSD
ncbi:unnamed protein product [Amoebophrya sp. A120]|nr:unnamed protein product [Amoebophrya sp. A120]|eukprot:GSA120T00020308001.1